VSPARDLLGSIVKVHTLRRFVGERELRSAEPDEVLGVSERVVKSAEPSDVCDGAQVHKMRLRLEVATFPPSLSPFCSLPQMHAI